MKLRQKERDEIEIDMSPMIDMVFLLLIFFIVASAVIKNEPVKIDVPSAVYAKVPEKEIGRAMITLAPDGNIYVGPQQKQVTLDDFKEWAAQELTDNEEVKFLIRADKTVKYRDTEKVVKACAEVGGLSMIFAAYEASE